MVKLRTNLVKKDNYKNKCPYPMNPTRIVIHNTGMDASATNEVAYMIRNTDAVSFHYAVDDKEVVQGVPINRNTWNAGDGNGKGNREGIAIEICYSKSGGERFLKAEQNAAEFAAYLLKQKGWGLDKITKHQDYNGKYCPHRTLDMGWGRFLKMVEEKLKGDDEMLSYEQFVEYQKRYEAEKAQAQASNWAKDSIEKCKASGIMTGDADGKFRPKSPITREEAAAIAVRLDERRKNND